MKKAKRKTRAEKEHLNKVAALGCIACKKLGYDDTPAELHHLRSGVGMGQRSSHFRVIPLCHHHHRTGNDSIHQSPATFAKKFGDEEQLLAEVNKSVGYT